MELTDAPPVATPPIDPSGPVVLVNALVATLADPAGYGLIPAGAIAISGGKVLWTGPAADLPGLCGLAAGRSWRAARHPGLRRLPHASGLRRLPRAGVRDAAGRREL